MLVRVSVLSMPSFVALICWLHRLFSIGQESVSGMVGELVDTLQLVALVEQRWLPVDDVETDARHADLGGAVAVLAVVEVDDAV